MRRRCEPPSRTVSLTLSLALCALAGTPLLALQAEPENAAVTEEEQE